MLCGYITNCTFRKPETSNYSLFRDSFVYFLYVVHTYNTHARVLRWSNRGAQWSGENINKGV